MSLITDSLNPWDGDKRKRWAVSFSGDGDSFFIASKPEADKLHIAFFIAKDERAAGLLATRLRMAAHSLEQAIQAGKANGSEQHSAHLKTELETLEQVMFSEDRFGTERKS